MVLHVGQGTSVAAVTVFPVWDSRASQGGRAYRTGGGQLVVRECDGGPQVPRLMARNIGSEPELVLDAQVFEGGWQHRMALASVLVPAGVEVAIDVACVEQGRWHGSEEQVTRGRRASSFVRGGYDVPGGGQSEVWQRVQHHGGSSETGSFLASLDRPDEVAAAMMRRVRPVPGQTGVLIGVGGQPLVLEVFDHPDTLAEQLEGILQAAALDAGLAPPIPTPGRRARRMVERLERTRLSRETNVHAGTEVGSARTPDLDVRVLAIRPRTRARTLHLRATYRRNPVMIGA